MPGHVPSLAERYWLVELEGTKELQAQEDREYQDKAIALVGKGLVAINQNLLVIGRMLSQRR